MENCFEPPPLSIINSLCSDGFTFFAKGWLFRLEEDGSHHSKALLDRYVARAAELKLPVSNLSRLSPERELKPFCGF